LNSSAALPSLLCAEQTTSLDKWFDFARIWGDSSSLIGLAVSLIGFALTFWGFIRTWNKQQEIKTQVSHALQNAARIVAQELLHQLLQKTIRVKDLARTQAWRTAHEYCEDAWRLALRAVANLLLTDEERDQMKAHADNLVQIRDYIKNNKLGENPSTIFQTAKSTALDDLENSVIAIQSRLQNVVWET
jgi:hypothetical protein